MSEQSRIATRTLPRSWTDDAVRLIQADARRSADTHLLRYPLPAAWSADADVALWGAFGLLAEMVAAGRGGSVVTLLADSGDRYADTYFNDEWVGAQGLDPAGHAGALVEFERSCAWN